MKNSLNLIFLFFLSLTIIACATTPVALPEKYANLENNLEESTEISTFRIDSWQRVDNQSLIIRSVHNDYYLIVLHRPSANLASSETIGITDTADKIRAGYDHVVVADSSSRDTYIIEKIYKLKDRKQVDEIKERLK